MATVEARTRLVDQTCHILSPSEIDRGLFRDVFAGSKGNAYFTELAETVECGNFVDVVAAPYDYVCFV